ncbi:hypothetical protein CCYA_CCYA02G0623 [Cyanidiococcus yangmingshanensis]|nr:hypothetical protein CCYA_CCYA02G0623 [Cyanidiococcus yangmingshanensis]
MKGRNWVSALQGPACVSFYRSKRGHDERLPSDDAGERSGTLLIARVAKPSPDDYRLVACMVKLGDWDDRDGSSPSMGPITVLGCIPGVGAAHAMWFPLLNELAGHCAAANGVRGCYLACLIDNRGCGGSDAYPSRPTCQCRSTATRRRYRHWWTVDALASDAWDVLEHVIATLRDSEKVNADTPIRIILLGHSLGTAVVCRMLLLQSRRRQRMPISGVLLMSMHRGWLRDWVPPSIRALKASVQYFWWYLRVSASSSSVLKDPKELLPLLSKRASIDLSLHLSDRFLAEWLDLSTMNQLMHLMPTSADSAWLTTSAEAGAVDKAGASRDSVGPHTRRLRRHEWFLRQYTADSYQMFRAWNQALHDSRTSRKLVDLFNLPGTLGQLHAIGQYRLTRQDLVQLRRQIPHRTILVYGRKDPVTLPRGCRALAHALGITAVELPGAHLITEESKDLLGRIVQMMCYDHEDFTLGLRRELEIANHSPTQRSGTLDDYQRRIGGPSAISTTHERNGLPSSLYGQGGSVRDLWQTL